MATQKKNEYVNEDYGGSVYDQHFFTQDELAAAADARISAESGNTSWDDAHSFVESIRKEYGYSGGTDGSQYIGNITDSAPKSGVVNQRGPSYTNKYQAQLDELTNAILNREAFTYDHTQDPTYQQYQEVYTREGQRAMQDTLGQVSARTGGLASSYAGVASQQTYDNYMAQLSDKVPELRALAYDMYLSEENRDRANLDMLMALEQSDYAKYGDLLSQYNTDRNFAYGVGRDQVADARYDQEWAYGVGRDQIADTRYTDETAWERSQIESESEYEKALEKAQTLASIGDFSGFLALGYTEQEIAGLQASYDAAQTLASGGRSYGGGTVGQGLGYEDVLYKALAYDNVADAKAYLEHMAHEGHITWDEATYIYEFELDGVTIPTTYEEFAEQTGNASIMTPDEFVKRRPDGYATYYDYLADMFKKYG